MKKLVFAISSLTLLLIVPKAHADVTNDVHVTTDGSNAHSSVVINNNGGTTTTNSYKTTGSTNIHVETNGQGYDYHSDKPGSVNVQSVNGKVTVNGQTQNTTSNTTQNTKPTMSATEAAREAQAQMEEIKKKAASQAAAMKKQSEEMKKTQENFIQKLINDLRKFFHFI